MHIGGKLHISEKPAATVATRIRRDSLAQSQALPSAAFAHYFGTPSSPPFSSYKTPEKADQPSVRAGYIFGVGYSAQRIFAEASIRQQLSGYSNLAEPLQPAFARPRLSVSVGYLLFDSKKKGITPLP